jgi:hypothetical protein
MTFAIVNVFPDPVTPSKHWCFVPEFNPSVSLAMAVG